MIIFHVRDIATSQLLHVSRRAHRSAQEKYGSVNMPQIPVIHAFLGNGISSKRGKVVEAAEVVLEGDVTVINGRLRWMPGAATSLHRRTRWDYIVWVKAHCTATPSKHFRDQITHYRSSGSLGNWKRL